MLKDITFNLDTFDLAMCGGIFALENLETKTIDIRYSGCMSKAVVNLLERFKYRNIKPKELVDDYINGKLRIIVLEFVNDPSVRGFKLEYWRDFYKQQGYKFYTDKKNKAFKLKIEVNNYLALVTLENHNYDKYIIGVFDKVSKAKSFISEYYNKTDIALIYANNELTKAYYMQQLIITDK